MIDFFGYSKPGVLELTIDYDSIPEDILDKDVKIRLAQYFNRLVILLGNKVLLEMIAKQETDELIKTGIMDVAAQNDKQIEQMRAMIKDTHAKAKG